jgi:AmmeMemoRadiSam system protein B
MEHAGLSVRPVGDLTHKRQAADNGNMETIPELPRIRPGLAVSPEETSLSRFILWDQLRISHEPQPLSLIELEILKRMDGRHTVRDLQLAAMQALGGILIPLEDVTALVRRLDEHLYLDSPRFDAYLGGPIREPACIGTYDANPSKLREQMRWLFTQPGGPGLPTNPGQDNGLRAALLPHMDYTRGNITYAWGFKEVFEHTNASLFVIIATSHYSPHRFTLTRKHFKTPLGIVETDQEFIDRLEKHYGEGLFDDLYCHFPEHSVELEVVVLHYLYENVRPFRIVPLVVGSFSDCIESGDAPGEQEDIRRMVEALRKAEAETPEPVCYIISGDLAHIGPKFGDRQPVAEPLLSWSEQQDRALIQSLEAVDPQRYFHIIASERDARRICGLPPTWTLLDAIRPNRGKLLHYGRYRHPTGHESVSFASVGFYR